MSILICGIFLYKILKAYFQGKPNFGWICAYSFLSPKVSIGDKRIDSLYFGLIIILACILIKHRGKIPVQKNKAFTRYYIMSCFVLVVYMVAWLLFNRNNSGMLITELAGAIKLLFVLYLIQEMNKNQSLTTIRQQIWKMFWILVPLNLVMCLLQMKNTQFTLHLIKELWDEGSYFFALECTKWGAFTRFFGVMPYPMHLAVFILIVFCFILFDRETLVKRKTLLLVMACICGAFSASKTFIVGIACIFLCWSIFEYHFCNRNKNFFIPIILVVVLIIISIVAFDQIYYLLQNHVSETAAQQWSTLRDISKVFKTRYSDDAEYLAYMPDFLKSYWLMGVGPASLDMEAIIDSAFYVILHNGGIIALCAVLFFYIWNLWYTFSNKMFVCFMLLIVILITGVGFPSWFASPLSTWTLGYIFFAESYLEPGKSY